MLPIAEMNPEIVLEILKVANGQVFFSFS